MLTNINEVVLWQTALHRLAGDHLVASDPLKPVFSAIVHLPPQSIDKKIYPCVFNGSRSQSKETITYYQSLRIDINEVKFIIAAAGNKERLL